MSKYFHYLVSSNVNHKDLDMNKLLSEADKSFYITEVNSSISIVKRYCVEFPSSKKDKFLNVVVANNLKVTEIPI